MCKNRKLLFFDIDGTLWDFNNYIPKSTVAAIQSARANGHLAFINSGRSRGFIRDENLLGIGFDGIVSGCGTMIEYRGDTIFYHMMEPDYIAGVMATLRRHGFKPLLEGREYLYIDWSEFRGDAYAQKLKRDLGENLKTIDEYAGRWEVSKLSCATEPGRHEGAMRELADEFEFMIHSPTVVEMVTKGFSKGEGIRRVCSLLGADISDTIAFGDSANDIPMLEVAGTAVVMGNGSDEAKSCADFVTTALHEDGIAVAMEKLKLTEQS